MVKIGKTELGKIPRIAISVTDKEENKIIRSLFVDILEIRVDQFKKLGLKYIQKIIANKKKTLIPLILTVRSKEEGGQRDISNELKLKIFKENISLVDAVDVELRSPILAELIKIAKKNKKILIISSHNFKLTPNDKIIKDILSKAKKRGANLVKIALKANRPEDVIRLLKFTLENKAKNLITISLGEIGSISRLVFPAVGSLITYAFISKPSGLGQRPFDELKEHLRIYYPQYNQNYIIKSRIIDIPPNKWTQRRVGISISTCS